MPVQDKIESPQRIHLLGYAALCLIWGSTWLAIRVVVRSVPPVEAAAVRFLLAAVLLLVIAVVKKRPWPRHHHEWDALIVLGFTIMAVPYGLLFWAEQYVTSSMTAVLFSSMPLFVALLTPLMSHARVPRQAVFSMMVAFGGLLVLFYSGLGTVGRALSGGIAILVAVILSAWSVIYAKRRLHGVDAVVSTGLQLAFGAIVLLWGTWALESRRHATWNTSAMMALVFLVGPQVPEAMGKAFEATQGELAGKLFAALKAGDAAGGDARGKQSASMLVVRNRGGRNINNDRYVYINVDDNAHPFEELRRLLDLNLAYNYGDAMYKALEASPLDARKAQAAGQKAIAYAPNEVGLHMNVAFVDYLTGDKQASLEEFTKARTLNPTGFNKSFKEESDFAPFKPMLADKDFLLKLFPDGLPQ